MKESLIADTPFQEIIKTRGVDLALHAAGNHNRYQYKAIAFLGIQWVMTSFVLMVQPFLTQVPIFLCKDDLDPTKTMVCTEKQSCAEGVQVSGDSAYNVVVEFELYCDKAHLRDLVGTIFFLGGSVGTLLFSHIADTRGRKTALMMAYTLGAIAFFILGLAPNLTVFLIFLAISWAGFDAYFAFSLIILNESGGTKLRGISNAILMVVWGVGLCIFIGLAYLIQNWRIQVIWVIAIPACLSCLLFTQIQESPRFLFAKRRLQECEDSLRNIAKVNKREGKIAALIDPTCASKSISLSKASHHSVVGQSKSSETSYLTLFTNRWLRKRFLLFTGLAVYMFISYNGILFALSSLGGSIYINSLIVSAAELFAYLGSLFMLENVKRKKSFVIIMLTAAFGGSVFALIPFISCESYFICSKAFLEGAMSLVIKFAVSLSFGLVYVYGSELFPTTARSKCIGLAASTGRGIGSLITWLNTGLMDMGINPVLFYGLLGFVVLILLKWLPETFGKKLIDEIPDEELEEVELEDENFENEEKELAAQETTN